MKDKKIWIGLGVVVILAVIIAIILSTKPESLESPTMEQAEAGNTMSDDRETTNTTGSSAIDTTVVDTTSSGTATYSMADVKQHSTQKDCWSAVNGGVYDLTEAISMHPGGPAAIAQICGVDGSSQFNKQHGSSQEANAALASFKIGDLQ